MRFPESGEYLPQGALAPVVIDVAGDLGAYYEPECMGAALGEPGILPEGRSLSTAAPCGALPGISTGNDGLPASQTFVQRFAQAR